MRCFVGIELDPATRSALLAVCDALRHADTAWAGEKWVRAENLHVTVAFLGEVDEWEVPRLAEAIGARLAEQTAFELPFTGLHAVPGQRRASMLWAAYGDPETRATALAREIEAVCELWGRTPEERKFKAHVTLVRARRPRAVANAVMALLEEPPVTVPALLSVPSATLYSSTLTKAGPLYRTLATWVFKSQGRLS